MAAAPTDGIAGHEQRLKKSIGVTPGETMIEISAHARKITNC